MPIPRVSEHRIQGDFVCRIEQIEELEQLAAERFDFDTDWGSDGEDDDDYYSFGSSDMVHVDWITDHGLDGDGTLTVKLEMCLYEDDKRSKFLFLD